MDENCAVVLPALAWATVRGADATDFLHGQFCADLLAVPENGACLTGWCTPQGRVVTTVFAARAADGWRLVLPENHAVDILRRLRRFVLRARVELQEAPPDGRVIGLGPRAAVKFAQDSGWRIFPVPGSAAAGHRFLACAAGPQCDAAQGAGQDGASGPADWLREDVRVGLPWIDAGTSGLFLPQELDLERWNGLSYSKGCYPGQEVVARLRYRGTVKRGISQMSAPGAALGTLVSGARLLDHAGRHAATVLYSGAAAADAIPVLAVVDHSTPAHTELQTAGAMRIRVLVAPAGGT